MTHHASPAFWKAYEALAPGVRKIADRSFALLKSDPQHASLRLKKVGIYWSARVGKRHRALAMEVEDGCYGSGSAPTMITAALSRGRWQSPIPFITDRD